MIDMIHPGHVINVNTVVSISVYNKK
jgi:hypothetical protein